MVTFRWRHRDVHGDFPEQSRAETEPAGGWRFGGVLNHFWRSRPEVGTTTRYWFFQQVHMRMWWGCAGIIIKNFISAGFYRSLANFRLIYYKFVLIQGGPIPVPEFSFLQFEHCLECTSSRLLKNQCNWAVSSVSRRLRYIYDVQIR
jgi:hypothetical protein